MTLEAGKEMDRLCVLNWLNEVYVTPSRAFLRYTDDELKMFAHDAIALLKEQEAKEQISDAIHETAKQFRQTIVRCEDCEHAGAAYFTDEGEMLYDCNQTECCRRRSVK